MWVGTWDGVLRKHMTCKAISRMSKLSLNYHEGACKSCL